MVNSVVKVHDLRVARGGNEILTDLDFEVGAGQITGLLGPSGCGKTTLMRAVVGTQAITGGSITVLDRLAGHPQLRSEIGYASQAASVYDDLTVLENLRYFAVMLHAGGDVDQVMDQVDLTKYSSRLTGTLSGGQRSRVSLAVAMLGTPKLLVLDEPTVGLDPVLREDLWTLFHHLSATGVTLLISSHVMEEAGRCDELLLMRDGRLLAQDSPDGLKRRTDTDSLDEAFLRLVQAEQAAA
ncbi:MAG: multidrug ABC transporter ATP-binding protein [Pseudonocardiales bacterium]|nr:MAG: multidrug ABC transporter ATP-binding protein [Pseudonocardiales bacterium]